jgi:hypothetical protein
VQREGEGEVGNKRHHLLVHLKRRGEERAEARRHGSSEDSIQHTNDSAHSEDA